MRAPLMEAAVQSYEASPGAAADKLIEMFLRDKKEEEKKKKL